MPASKATKALKDQVHQILRSAPNTEARWLLGPEAHRRLSKVYDGGVYWIEIDRMLGMPVSIMPNADPLLVALVPLDPHPHS